MTVVSRNKFYPCEKCGRIVPVRSKGLCPSCRQKEKNYMKKKLIGASNKNPGIPGFFRLMLEKLEYSRMSYTGRPINFPTVANICHILPKRTYKSVSMDEENIIFLTNEEHTRFDELIDRLEFEKLESEYGFVWKRAVRQVLSMEAKEKIKERGKLIIEIIDTYEKKN